MKDLSASIVVYRNPANILAQTIHSFLCSTQDSRLYILDNSPTDQLKYLAYNPRITYIFNSKNVGFGAGHNISLRRVIDESKYHLVLNPDVYFDASVLPKLYQFMESNPDIGQAMPKVLYPDGRLQPLCKLLPSPKTLLIRRFFGFLKSSLQKENYMYELHFTGYDKIMDVPFLSGCFMFLRMEALKKVGLFDERFFLYTEDTDLSRRIHKYFRTVYYPEATIFHHHQRGSYKNLWLFWCSLRSAFYYFNKWGWAVDEERETFNNKTLQQLSYVTPAKAT
jgi:GT2 family glycosyltransferase